MRTVALSLAVTLAAGCASGYTVVDRSAVVVSQNSQVVAKSLVPEADTHPRVTENLALAEEIYEKQLSLLKERRNKVRARRRGLTFTSFGIMAASGLSAGAAAIGGVASAQQKDAALIGAGVTSLVGLGLGTVLQIASLMQEDHAAVDDKIHLLERLHRELLERLHEFADEKPMPESRANEAITKFIDEVLAVQVKG
jgi:hypothetical protein